MGLRLSLLCTSVVLAGYVGDGMVGVEGWVELKNRPGSRMRK